MTTTDKKFKVLTGWDDGLNIKLVLKKDDQTILKEFSGKEWYFAVKKEAFDKIKKDAFEKFNTKAGRQVVTRFATEGDFVKIYCDQTARDPKTMNLIDMMTAKGITVYEADLSRTKRFMVDKMVQIADKLNILYFDIETDDTRGGIE